MRQKRPLIIILLLIGAYFLFVHDNEKPEFIFNEGYIFGTSYHISYESPEGINYGDSVRSHLMNVVDQSLSTFNKTSTISLVNQNKPHTTDAAFEQVFNRGKEISLITNGAFDMTIAPLVNLWGFGYTKKEDITPSEEDVNLLMNSVGYDKVDIVNHQVIKQSPNTKFDASAIAKGYSVDVAAQYLMARGISNYMVEIGGEIRVGGQNKKGLKWSVGIDKPIDDVAASSRQLDTVVYITDKAVATSGNYRQFYYKDGKRFSHTIDPLTGYPVIHQLLSATVIANDCMTADAFATACMVMGADRSLLLAETQEGIEVFLIVDDNGQTKELFSEGFSTYLRKQ